MEELSMKMQSQLQSFKQVQTELQKAISTRQQLDGQLNENDIVKQELDLMPEDGKVYKSVGPVLIKTDLLEAKQNVVKRMDYISNEIKRLDSQIETLEKKQVEHKTVIQKLQQQLAMAGGMK
ncbi:unnamed protein product [Acanthoscelides obtectus]|uniref:Probable prefoldin subunit 6 n=1 Tax=Acanthoscelides obtectus TaxID=200917 RepID=A0A9P0Q151_ACAOB|nr:unnamed protein product [Acanthoscelides obtectus]CAK1645127.1 Probable prefoldin subunit 6 [Acanthoscelides obtectus]